ncbi:MAG: hypothetical protein RI911_128 [Candidatus Parcubacteria bacterium]
MRTLGTLPPCEGCGEVRVIHPLEKGISWIEEHVNEKSGRNVPKRKLCAHRLLKCARFLERLGICRLATNPAHTIDSRIHALFEGAAASNLVLYEVLIRKHHVCFFATYEDERAVWMFKHLPHELLEYHSEILIDDKYELATFLRSHSRCVPETWSVTNKTIHALPVASKEQAFVVKPRIGTRGRHTTLHHVTPESLIEGVRFAMQISTRVVVQREVNGEVYRCTVVNGHDVYVARRKYPFVVGDGIHSIEELVITENTQPYRDGVYFRKLVFGIHERNFLRVQHIDASYVPQKGEVCTISDKNSRRNGTTVEDVTAETHPTIIEEARMAAQLIGTPIVGFDIILENHMVPINNQSTGIIEANSVPYIDVHHRVVSGNPHNVAAKLFSLVIDTVVAKTTTETLY